MRTQGLPLDGAAVSVPAGALPIGAAIVVGTAPDIPTSGTQTGAGPTVFFGPQGLRFGTTDDPKPATLTIPFDGAFSDATDQITIYTRDARGIVTPVARPYAFDLLADTVSFQPSHFSSFRAVAPTSARPGNFVTVARIADPRAICRAFSPDLSSASPIYLYAAEGGAKTVAAIRRPVGSTSFTRETWVGGGTQTTTPADRPQFDNCGPMSFAPGGGLYVADGTRIRHIDAARNVNVTVAGQIGNYGSTGDGGPPTSALFENVFGLSRYLDPRNPTDDVLAVADVDDHTLRFVNLTKGTVRLVAGAHGAPGFNGDNGSTPGRLDVPASVAVAADRVFVCVFCNRPLRQSSNP